MIHFKSIICSSLLDKRLEEIFSTDLYQKMSDIYRTKLTLPLFQICWISFDPKLVNIIKLQLISSFSPQTWKQSFSLNLLNLISIALSYTKTDQSRCWAWHCSTPACSSFYLFLLFYCYYCIEPTLMYVTCNINLLPHFIWKYLFTSVS